MRGCATRRCLFASAHNARVRRMCHPMSKKRTSCTACGTVRAAVHTGRTPIPSHTRAWRMFRALHALHRAKPRARVPLGFASKRLARKRLYCSRYSTELDEQGMVALYGPRATRWCAVRLIPRTRRYAPGSQSRRTVGCKSQVPTSTEAFAAAVCAQRSARRGASLGVCIVQPPVYACHESQPERVLERVATRHGMPSAVEGGFF